MPQIEVFGAGIFGLTVAWCLQKRGARVRVIEKRHVGAGSSGGIVGAMAPHTPDSWNAKKQFQFESLTASAAFWAEVDAVSGLSSGYGRIGRLSAVDTPRALELALERARNCDDFWHGQAEWTVLPVSHFADWMPENATGFLVHDTLSARINPKAACESLARAFQIRGGEIIEGTDQGLGADATVLATGYEGLAEMSGRFGRSMGTGVKGQGVLLDFDARDRSQIFAEGIHFVPHENGTLALGSTSEIEWNHDSQTDEKLDALLARAVAICPGLRGAGVVGRWAGIRPRGARRTPVLGRYPGRPDTYVANGGFKIGFGVVVKAGEVMADLILNGQADIPKTFTPEAMLGHVG